MSPHVAVVDYGMGNVWSVISALRYLGATVELVSDSEVLAKADCIVLPGVGSFKKGMENLKKNGIDEVIRSVAIANKTKILGICLGMQLLADTSEEHGKKKGLSLIPGEVQRMQVTADLRLPHIGWNTIKLGQPSSLFDGVEEGDSFYFVHSYFVEPSNKLNILSTTSYNLDFASALYKDNIAAVQFHPEKSSKMGLKLLENFINWNGEI